MAKGAELLIYEAVARGLVSRRPVVSGAPEQRKWAAHVRLSEDPSENHARLGATADVVNLANRCETVRSADAQLAKLELALSGPLLGKEFLGRSEYLVWNADYHRVCRELLVELEEPDLAQQSAEAVRAVLAYLALGALPVEAKGLTADQLDRDGPGCIVADGPTPRGAQGLPAVTACGARSANNKPAGTAGRRPPPGAPTLWRNWIPCAAANLLGDALNGHLDPIGNGLSRRGCDGRWATPEEAAILQAALRDEPRALLTLLEWIHDWRPKEGYRILRRENGVASLSLEGHQSSTARLYGCAALRNGVQRFLVADPGGRDTGAGDDDVAPGHCEVTANGSLAVAQRDDGSLEPAAMPLPGGRTILDVETRQTAFVIHASPLTPEPPVVVEPPVVIVPPKPKRESWWRRLLRSIFGS